MTPDPEKQETKSGEKFAFLLIKCTYFLQKFILQHGRVSCLWSNKPRAGRQVAPMEIRTEKQRSSTIVSHPVPLAINPFLLVSASSLRSAPVWFLGVLPVQNEQPNYLSFQQPHYLMLKTVAFTWPERTKTHIN
jgi:hypothetical protein